ncbi:anther-specific protein BCP1-like [Forsythia ovata]|uniref:Anther-specific protein BCP1-like n=1 Tax=Forsythia ovata TaxID=205694 RepID=A0ABD1WCR9_9LAMI
MARQLIVLALVFFAIVGMASAAGDHKDAHAEGAAAPKASDGVIGTTSGATPDAAPVGGPVPAGTFNNLAPGPSATATRCEVTTVVGAFAAAAVADLVKRAEMVEKHTGPP